MNKIDLENKIKNEKEKFPISFHYLEFTDNEDIKNHIKVVNSVKYKDSSFSVLKFYKPITKF